MATEIVMPQMGAEMEEGTVVRWLKQPGEFVSRGETIAEIETDKTTVEMEAMASGTIAEIVVGEGGVAAVGAVIAYLDGDG